MSHLVCETVRTVLETVRTVLETAPGTISEEHISTLEDAAQTTRSHKIRDEISDLLFISRFYLLFRLTEKVNLESSETTLVSIEKFLDDFNHKIVSHALARPEKNHFELQGRPSVHVSKDVDPLDADVISRNHLRLLNIFALCYGVVIRLQRNYRISIPCFFTKQVRDSMLVCDTFHFTKNVK